MDLAQIRVDILLSAKFQLKQNFVSQLESSDIRILKPELHVQLCELPKLTPANWRSATERLALTFLLARVLFRVENKWRG